MSVDAWLPTMVSRTMAILVGSVAVLAGLYGSGLATMSLVASVCYLLFGICVGRLLVASSSSSPYSPLAAATSSYSPPFTQAETEPASAPIVPSRRSHSSGIVERRRADARRRRRNDVDAILADLASRELNAVSLASDNSETNQRVSMNRIGVFVSGSQLPSPVPSPDESSLPRTPSPTSSRSHSPIALGMRSNAVFIANSTAPAPLSPGSPAPPASPSSDSMPQSNTRTQPRVSFGSTTETTDLVVVQSGDLEGMVAFNGDDLQQYVSRSRSPVREPNPFSPVSSMQPLRYNGNSSVGRVSVSEEASREGAEQNSDDDEEELAALLAAGLANNSASDQIRQETSSNHENGAPSFDMDKLLSDLDAAIAIEGGSWSEDAGGENDDEDSESDIQFVDHVTECKNLVSLLYAISEDQARKDGFVHRGVTCNHCGAQPIRGIRYHCLNCPDYDLCETCENLGDAHLRTHSFVKIRIPLAPHANLRGASAPVMYPGLDMQGTGERTWSRDEEVQKVVEDAHFETVEIQALFEQFLTLATVPPGEDTPGGINRTTFDLSLGALGKEQNLITDRIFAFFDQDADGIICFHEFVIGLGVMIKGTLDERIEYAFKGYDLDGDGVVSRQELHKMFKAYFYLSMQLVRDYVKSVEMEMMETFDDEAAKPVSASFTAPIPSSGTNEAENADNDAAAAAAKAGYEASGSISRPNTGLSSASNTHSERRNSQPLTARASYPSLQQHQQSRPETSTLEVPASLADTPVNVSATSSSSMGLVISTSQAVTSSAFNALRSGSSSSAAAVPSPLSIDVGGGKTVLGKLPSAIHESDSYMTSATFSRYPTPTSTTRRSPSPTSNTIDSPPRSPQSATFYNPPSARALTGGRLSSASSIGLAISAVVGTAIIPTTDTTAMSTSGGLLSRGTRALQEVQALRRRSNVSLRSIHRDGSISATAAAAATMLQSPVSPFEDILWGGVVGAAVAASGSGGLFVGEDGGRLPVIEAMSQDAIEEMVERTFVAAGASQPDFITLEEFRRAVEHDHSYLQWFEALGSVF
ncbi:hypothetical protein BC830DRAFT_1132041 [Chytriomyces sp. MP71]|nr:hypothetical protein BC830DRAFT_1132041 [Chytriomyces sp. MP71]